MRKKIFTFICIALVLLMAACTRAAPQTSAEELSAHQWSIDGNDGGLSFSDGIMTLLVGEKGKLARLEGEYFADDRTITLMDKDAGTVRFDYCLKNEKLLLSYSGKELTLCKTN